MKVTEHIEQAKDTLVSFEILPPLKGKTINSIYEHLDPLMEFKPAFVDVTYHREEYVYKKRDGGYRVRDLRSIIVAIAPPRLHDEGLATALRDLVSPLSARGLTAALTG